MEKKIIQLKISKSNRTEHEAIFNRPNMKYFPGRNALHIKYISGSRVHDKIYMVHGNGPLKGFKAAKSQTPNLPSPPFTVSMVTLLGSSCSLTPLKAQKPPGHKGTATNDGVTSLMSLCPGGGFYIN